MEQLCYILTQESDQKQVNEFVQEQYSNPEFGSILFEILQNDSSETIPRNNLGFMSKCCFLLKQWAKLNWNNMECEHKAQYFDSLKKIILSTQESYVIHLVGGFIDMAEREYHNKDGNLVIFKSHYDDFFSALSTPQNYSMNQLTGLLDIIVFASHSYKKAREDIDPNEVSVFLTKITEIIFPYLENQHFLESSEGCKILCLVLESIKVPFFKIKPPIENASIPLGFSETIEAEFIKKNFLNTKLVREAVSFLKRFYNSSYDKNHFENIAPQILQTHFELLSAALEIKDEDGKTDYYLISKILQVIEHYEEAISVEENVINILLEAAKLTPTDEENFRSNPNLFYYDVYQRTFEISKGNSSKLARSIISNFCSDNEEVSTVLISYLITLPPSENVVRCLGICIKASEGDKRDRVMIPLPPNIFPYSLELLQNQEYHQNPIFISSILDFLYYLVPHLDVEQNCEIMNEMPNYFKEYKNNSIVTVMLTRLLKNLIKNDVYPFDNAIEAIIQALETSFTKQPLKCLKALNEISNEAVIPYSDSVLEGIFYSINRSFNLISGEEEEEAEADDIDKQDIEMNNIRSNLDFCSKLIKCTGAYLVKPFFIEIVQNVFQYDIDCECIDEVVDLLISIFGSGTQLVPEFVKLIIEACHQDPWDNHSFYLIQPIFQVITSNPQMFIEFTINKDDDTTVNLCSFLGEFCMAMLTNQEFSDPGNYLYFATLLSWIIILDSKNSHELGEADIQNIYQCGLTICSMEDSKIHLVSSFLEILASISVSYNTFPSTEIINLMVNAVKCNWILRFCQKQLYIIFFLSLATAQNEFTDSSVQMAFILMNRMAEQKSMDESEYFANESYPHELDYLTLPFDFKSPIELFSLKKMAQAALQLCQPETIGGLQHDFPGILEQFSESQQQDE